MTAKVILNPYAGRWKALQRKEELTSALVKAGIDFDLEMTQYPDHGIEIASRSVSEGFSPIVSAGGDGSISEVVNGILRGAADIADDHIPPLGVMPLGTANDFVVNMGLPKTLEAAAQVIAAGNTRRMDVGLVNSRYFDNNSAIGLEPTVTILQRDMKRLKGTLRYLTATLLAIAKKPQWTAKLEWEGGFYEGPISLVTVGIGKVTGGLFYMCPHADPYDGLLTFVHGFMPSRLKILQILPKTMKPGPGSYVEHPSIHEFHTPWLRIHTDQPTPIHADGEIQSEALSDFEFLIVPQKLPVLSQL